MDLLPFLILRMLPEKSRNQFRRVAWHPVTARVTIDYQRSSFGRRKLHALGMILPFLSRTAIVILLDLLDHRILPLRRHDSVPLANEVKDGSAHGLAAPEIPGDTC